METSKQKLWVSDIKAMLQGSQGVRVKTYILDYKHFTFFAYFRKSGG